MISSGQGSLFVELRDQDDLWGDLLGSDEGQLVCDAADKGQGILKEQDAEVQALDFPIATIIRHMILAVPLYAIEHAKQQYQNVAAYLDDGCLSSMPTTTSCSGTDIIVPILAVLFSIFAHVFDLEAVGVLHEWSCENEQYKCRWIREVMSGKLIFADCAELPKEIASLSEYAYSFSEFMTAPVTVGLLHAAGFSCRSVSLLNPNRSSFLNCTLPPSDTV